MPQIVQHKRSVTQLTSPAAANGKEGEIAISFGGVSPGTTTTPAAWAHDGVAWRRLNPPGAAPVVRSEVSTGGAGTAVEAAWNAENAGAGYTVAANEIVIYSHDGSAYIYTGPAGTGLNSATNGQFTPLGSATQFATESQIRAGAPSGLAVSNDLLAAILGQPSVNAGTTAAQPSHPTTALQPAASGAVTDAGRIVVLDSTGHIPASLMAVQGFDFQAADVTTAPTGANFGHQNGRIVTHTGAAGTINAGWTPMATGSPTTVDPGDMLMSDGTNWHVLLTSVDMSQYLPLTGGTLTPPAAAAGAVALTFDMSNAVAAAGGNKQAVDFGGGELTNGVIDGGTF